MSENTTTPTRRPVWLIAGASSGIGQAIALQVQPWARVTVIGRNTERLHQMAEAGFETIQLDFTASPQIIRCAIESIVDREGFIDVFVNAGGYILEGSVEETSDQEMQQVFETNTLGPLRFTRILLPYMRRARRGIIAHIAGIGSYSGAPNAGIFCSSKAAMAIALEALQQEVISFGVRVCLIQLGHFRTPFLSAGHRQKVSNRITDYDPVLTPIRRIFDTFDGAQQGDPEKGARVIVKALTKEAKEVPFLLPVGPDVPGAEWQAHKGRVEQMQAVQDWASRTDLD